jgi:hypothetical protein
MERTLLERRFEKRSILERIPVWIRIYPDIG